MNDKSAKFPAIHHNFLKHGWNLSLLDFLEFVILFTALVLVDLLAYHQGRP